MNKKLEKKAGVVYDTKDNVVMKEVNTEDELCDLLNQFANDDNAHDLAIVWGVDVDYVG